MTTVSVPSSVQPDSLFPASAIWVGLVGREALKSRPGGASNALVAG